MATLFENYEKINKNCVLQYWHKTYNNESKMNYNELHLK